jgi:hypothetical protein
MLLELLGTWGDMAHVVKGMWGKEGFDYHLLLERGFCLAGLN